MFTVALDQVEAVLAAEDSLVWLHFDQADTGARAWIQDCHRLPQDAKTLLLGSDSHMRIEAAGHGLAGVVGDLHHEFASRSDHLDVLRLYLDNRCLISARREPMTAIDKLRRSIGEGLKAERPISLVTQFLHHVTDTLGDLMLELGDTLDTLEDAVLEGRTKGAGEELIRIRRVAARLRRHMAPQQHVLLGLLSRLPPWVEQPDATRLRHAIERMSALGHDLELVQDRCRLLQEQASARLAESTNRNLYLLSIVTILALPPTLISGLFGMNLGGMPELMDPMGFWYGLGLIVLAIGVSLVILRRMKML